MATPDASGYAVWLVQGTRRVQVGTLAVDARGAGAFVLPQPLPFDRPERIEVTRTSGASDADTNVVLSATF
jgi:hypothetical protein